MRGKIRLLLPAVALILVVAGLLSDDRSGYICGLGILLFALILLSSAYGRRLGTGEIVLIASMAAISCVGRVAFYWLPQFKPVTAIVIISGIMLGAGAGGVVGALSAFLSNFFFGQGVWTPYQMLSWGIIGYVSGLLFRKSLPKWKVMLWGGFSAFFIYGGIMNMASVLMFTAAVDLKTAGAVYLSGLPFDLLHAASTAVFLYFIYNPLRDKLERVVTKYGLLVKKQKD